MISNSRRINISSLRIYREKKWTTSSLRQSDPTPQISACGKGLFECRVEAGTELVVLKTRLLPGGRYMYEYHGY